MLFRSLNRSGVPTAAQSRDRMLMREVIRKRCKPYIYSAEEVRLLLETARHFPSPKAPLRQPTLYTMIVLAYCAGLRVGEIVGLEMKDIDLKAGTIEVRDTKFFKSRRLPLSADALEALQNYVKVRERAGASMDLEATLFCHENDSYRRSLVLPLRPSLSSSYSSLLAVALGAQRPQRSSIRFQIPPALVLLRRSRLIEVQSSSFREPVARH